MFKQYTQDQGQLLPPSLGELIAPDHMARLISHAIDRMDISAIERTYSDQGQHAFHPTMLLKVLVYGYSIGTRSSRKLADKLKEDVVFMWLAGRQTPDFRTIALFRKDRLVDLKLLFQQVLELCFDLGMIRVGKVCIDGTTMRASANKNKSQYRKVLEKRGAKIKQQIDDIFAEAERLDKEEEVIYSDNTPHTTGKPLTGELKQKISDTLSRQGQGRIKKIKRRKETLKRNQKKLKARQSDVNGKLRKMRKDRNTMSSADKDATLMLMKEQYIAPGYNVQLATEHQVILAFDVTSDRNDTKQYKPMVKQVKENTSRKPKTTITDAGYGTKMNYRFAKNERLAAFMPYNQYNNDLALRKKGIYEFPQNIDIEWQRYKAQQLVRLQSEEGKQLIKRRRQDVEPVIGNIKRNMKFRRFLLRGKPKCLTEIGLVSIAHNMKKIKQWTKKLAQWDDGRTIGREYGKILAYIPA